VPKSQNAVLNSCRKNLLKAVPLGQRSLYEDSVRGVGRFHSKELALHLARHWDASKSREDAGMIDVIDMFSGCGGMSAGFRTVNSVLPVYRHILAVDIDEVANETYECNLGLRPTRVSVADLVNRPNQLKATIEASARDESKPLVLIGCAPCQGFSSHRNGDGEGDLRNNLFLNFARIATRLQPTAVIVENVPELLTTRYWSYVQEARRILHRAGYFVHLSVCNMAEFGVPQERFRAVMLAMKHPFAPITGFLDRKHFRTVRDAISHLPAVDAGERCGSDLMHFTAKHQETTVNTIRAVPRDGGNRPDGVGPACLTRVREKQGRGGYDDVYGRLSWDKPAITITAYSRNPASGRFVHPFQDRGLSIREAALLQGFPPDYQFKGSLDDAFRQIGNAVPPAFAACLGMHVLGEILTEDHLSEMSQGIEEPLGSSFSRLIPSLKAGNARTGSSLATI